MTSRVNFLQPVYLRTVFRGTIFSVIYVSGLFQRIYKLLNLHVLADRYDLTLCFLSGGGLKGWLQREYLWIKNTSCGFHFACILNILKGAVNSRISEFEGSTTGGGVYVLDKE